MSPNLPLRGTVAVAAAAVFVVACATATPTASPTAVPSATVAPSTPSTPTPSLGPTTPGASATTTPTTAVAPSATSIAFEVVVGGLVAPLDVTNAGDGSGRLFVAEQAGRIRIVRDGRLVGRAFLDIRERIRSGGERGLLGIAFHPRYPDDSRVFVDYTDLDGDTVVSSFTVTPVDPNRADPTSEQVLLRVDQPFGNHNGGGLAFGPDGMLHIATGDGGGGGDPTGAGQRLDTLLGKILRIDVDGRPAGDRPYAIPDDNPFVGRADARGEIWLYGLRNPWRIRFDRETGDLWLGDVGQNQWEEIDVAPAGVGGLNFGWNRTEGSHCYPSGDGCDRPNLTGPIAEYDHRSGCSVIGGVGAYVFADYCSGNVWLIDAGVREPQIPTLALRGDRSISAFGEDESGEAFATDIEAGELVRIETSR